MNRVFMQRLAWLARGAALLGVLASGGNALAQATPFATVTTSGPLTRIFLGDELGMQVEHSGDPVWEVFPSDDAPGDFGTFAVVGGALYGPDFDNHGGGGTAAGPLGTPFTPVSQTAAGTGTAANPYKVVTTVDAGATGIGIEQTVTYVTGNEFFNTDTVLTNSGATAQTVLLYRAMDCFMGGSDRGYGYANAAASVVACTKNANNTPADRVEALYSLTPGGHYWEGPYGHNPGEIWGWIVSQQPFDDSCQCAVQQDNALGYSWSVTVPAGGSVTVSDRLLLSRSGSGFGPSSPAGTAPVPAIGLEALAALALLMAALAAWTVRQRQRR